jgi:hypothetical protein
MDQQDGSRAELADSRAFAEAVEQAPHRPGPTLRLGPAVAAVVLAALAAVGAVVIPQMIHHPGGLLGLGQSAPGSQAGQGQPIPPGAQGLLPGDPASSSYPLTYGSHLIAGPGAACCFSAGGTWSTRPAGGYPGGSGPVKTSAGPTAWSEWAFGRPSGGHRWDQVKVRVWIPAAGAGAWVRFTVTATAGGASSASTFDVPEQEYEGWYELPATFTIGTPGQRTGSLWVRMTYLRPYPGPGCADGSCNRMAAAQAELLWS